MQMSGNDATISCVSTPSEYLLLAVQPRYPSIGKDLEDVFSNFNIAYVYKTYVFLGFYEVL